MLRPFRQEDLSALHALDAQCFPPRIAYSRAELYHFLQHPRSESFIAEEAGVIAGFCIVDWKLEAGKRVGHFITIDVHPERRRSGLGSMLMLAGERYLQTLGCLAITLEVATDNAVAQRFYGRHGYARTGRIPGYYADNTDALVMRKSLDTDDRSG